MKQETAYKLLIISFAIVYIAFGVPKILGATSVKDLMQAGYPFFNDAIIGFMGIVEIILGFCLIVKKTRSLAALGIILHLLGTLSTFVLNFNYFFNSQTIFTLEGEFVFKNIVFISLALYILSKENTIKLPQFLNKANGSNQN